MNQPYQAVEILDAADPAVTRRVCRIARDGLLGVRTVGFWYLCAELALLVAFGCWLVLDLPWWAAAALGAPGGVLAHVGGLCAGLHLQVGIRPGDQWYRLVTPRGQALALVKTRNGTTFVASAAADSIALSRELRRLVERETGTDHGNEHFVIPPH